MDAKTISGRLPSVFPHPRAQTGSLMLVIATLPFGSRLAGPAATQSGPEKVVGLYVWYKADSIVGLKDGDVVNQWRDSGPRHMHLDKRSGGPVFSSKAIGQLPSVRFREGTHDGLRTSSTVPALAGDPSFTVFAVAKIARPEAGRAHPLGWGDGGAGAGAGMILELEAGRLDLATGFSADATTPDGVYADHFGKPTIIVCTKSPGPMGSTTRISFNGVPAPVSGSAIVPRVQETRLNIGGDPDIGYVSPAMDLSEVILFRRVLSLAEQNRVGYYLSRKYGIEAKFTKREVSVVRLRVRAEPSEVEGVVGFVGEGEQIKGSSVEVIAQQRVVVRDALGPRVYYFDHWKGDVAERGAFRTMVHIDREKAIAAVYKEKKVDIYVATNGRDDWSGLLPEPNAAKTDGPFATLPRAREAVRQFRSESGGQLRVPVKVLVRGGKYYLDQTLALGPEDSGTREGPVTYMAYPTEKPVLSGGRKATGWQPYKGRILQCPLVEARGGQWKFRQLFYNGQRQIRARTPDLDPKDPLLGGWASMEGPAEPGSQTAFRYKPETFKHRWAKPAEAEVNVYIGYDWANNIIPVKGIDEERRVITLAHSTTRFTKPPLPYDYPTPFNPNQRFIVENVLEELDQPGEWCLDSEEGKLYLWPPEQPIENAEVVVPRLDCLIDLQGVSHVTISGFAFTETTGGDNFHHEGCEGVGAMFAMPGWKYCGDALHLTDAEHCLIANNRFFNVGGNAIYLEGHNARNILRGNEIGDVGACGVCLAGSRDKYPVFNQIEDNHIHHTGLMNMYSAGVFAGFSEGNVIGHNSIHHVPHHAINLGDSSRSRNIIEYNEIRHTCLQTSDTGAINCWMETGDRTAARQGHLIRYNLIADSRERGIYLDNYTSNCFVYGNVIVRPRQWAIIVHGGKNNVIENNIIVEAEAAIAVYDGIDGLMPHMALFSSGNRFCANIVFGARKVLYLEHKRPDRAFAQTDFNLFFNTGDERSYLESRQEAGYEMHSLIADPLFVDPEHDDYRLKPASPAIRQGFQPVDTTQIGIRKVAE